MLMHRYTFHAVLLTATMTLHLPAHAKDRDEPAQYEGYELVWHDEFDVDGPPNPDHWRYEKGFVRNHEAQWYTEENVRCMKGYLVFEARRVNKPNPNYEAGSDDWKKSRKTIEYTSSSINTSGKHQWLYGRFEVRAKVDIHDGMWPAIWTLGSAREWPGCGEIDIMEYYRGGILANACWASGKRWSGIWDSSKTPVTELGDASGGNAKKWAEQFHVWRMDWDENEIKLYVDDRLLNTIELSKTINQTPDHANPFREPHYLLLNLAIGGDQGGDPSKTPFPRHYLVDYVRVYQKTKGD